MIGFLRIAKRFPNLPSRAVSLLSLIPILHLPNHSFVFLTNASIFDPTLRPSSICIGLRLSSRHIHHAHPDAEYMRCVDAQATN